MYRLLSATKTTYQEPCEFVILKPSQPYRCMMLAGPVASTAN